jgi:hypothetical protein
MAGFSAPDCARTTALSSARSPSSRRTGWAERRLAELERREERVVVLGLRHGDRTPRFDTRIRAGDRLVAYAPPTRLSELDGGAASDWWPPTMARRPRRGDA